MNFIGNRYHLLKYGDVDNRIALRAEYIKDFNDIYCDAYRTYFNDYIDDVDGLVVPPEFIGTILHENNDNGTPTYSPIPRPFDDELYPYNRYMTSMIFNTGCQNIKLFRIVSIELIRGNGFYALKSHAIMEGNQILPESLIWIDVDALANRHALNKERSRQHRAIEKLTSSLPYDMEYEIKQYFAGSKKRVSKKRKQKKSRKSSKK